MSRNTDLAREYLASAESRDVGISLARRLAQPLGGEPISPPSALLPPLF